MKSFLIAIAAAVVLLRVISAEAQIITLGETAILGIADSGNAGLLLTQGPYQLSQAATINSLQFYTTTVSGQVRLGIYTSGPNHNCKDGSLKAQTIAFTPNANSWNASNVTKPVQLPVGSYCIAFEVSSNSTGFAKGMTTGIGDYWRARSFGTFPSTFSSAPSGPDGYHWSLYATLTGAAPTLSVMFSPPSPGILASAPLNTIVAQIVPKWSDGSQFTGTVAFGSPDFSDGGCFAIDGSLNLIIACDLSGDGNTTQSVTVTATQ